MDAVHSGTGVFYQAMPAVGADGKNIMKLIPVQMVNGQFVQTPAGKSKTNSAPQNAFIMNNAPGPVHLVEKETKYPATEQFIKNHFSFVNVSPNQVTLVLNNSVNKPPLQQQTVNLKSKVPQMAAPSSVLEKLVRLPNEFPVTVKSPALPRGQYLRISPNAQVQRVPVSELPPGIKEQIFTSSASSSVDSSSPSVVLVSPVTTVSQAVPEPGGSSAHEVKPQPKRSGETSCALPLKRVKPQLKLIPKFSQRPNSPTRWVIEEVDGSLPENRRPLNSPSVPSSILGPEAEGGRVFQQTTSRSSQGKNIQGQENSLVVCNGKVFFVAKNGGSTFRSTAARECSEVNQNICPAPYRQSAAAETNLELRTPGPGESNEVIDLCDDDDEAQEDLRQQAAHLDEDNVIFVSYIPPTSEPGSTKDVTPKTHVGPRKEADPKTSSGFSRAADILASRRDQSTSTRQGTHSDMQSQQKVSNQPPDSMEVDAGPAGPAGPADSRSRGEHAETEKKASETEEALKMLFEDSSDSEHEYAPGEDNLFLRGVDPALDNLDDEGDDDEWKPSKSSPAPFQSRKKRKLCPGLQGTDSPPEASLPGPSSSAPPPPRPSKRRRRNSAPPILAHDRGEGSPVRIPGTERTEEGAGEGVKWLQMSDKDSKPAQPDFLPCQPIGPTIGTSSTWTPFTLFKLFFSSTVVHTLITNTNKMARKMKEAGRKFLWNPVTKEEFYIFLAVIVFCGLVKCPSRKHYWRKKEPYNFHFPASVMSRNRFSSIFWCLHLSDPDEDEENERRKGTPRHDRLFKLKPLYDDILVACKALYHPDQQLSIDERMLTTKPRLGFKQYLPLKPTKRGMKLFVLADVHGYAWNYFICEGKTSQQLTDGLGHSAVMRLLDLPVLGTGYQLYMENIYTSPKLLHDLHQKQIMACGTMLESRRGFPGIKRNKLSKKARRGEFRWLRVDGLLFIQWMDTKRVTLASNFHQAFSGFATSRRVRDEDGVVRRTAVPIPDAAKDYNAFMGGVDRSDALIGYYSLLHKTMKWYKKVFHHMVDIAVVNSYIIYKRLAAGRGETPVGQKKFRERLIKEMAPHKRSPTSQPPSKKCGPFFPSQDSTKGRRQCAVCKNKTPVICRKCMVPLCLIPKRNCYVQWHDES